MIILQLGVFFFTKQKSYNISSETFLFYFSLLICIFCFVIRRNIPSGFNSLFVNYIILYPRDFIGSLSVLRKDLTKDYKHYKTYIHFMAPESLYIQVVTLMVKLNKNNA